ncbi:DUF2490 domain-containing protein [Tenacibaculum sp. MEBiC06402]|uniref:DUF2490 domain-containing protein n=1 Tax=unclassified Tenacibaculum TaxID=2635139 RepID=UPI003B9A4672
MKKFAVVFFLFGLLYVNSQSELSFGSLPKVNLSKKFSSSVKWVNSIESREIIYNKALQFNHNLVDVSTILSVKTDVYQSFNFGYIVRFSEGETVHRLLQHFNVVQNFDNMKLAHRLGMEQFFQEKIKPQYRTRYRVTFEKPLNGEKVDVKEWYLKVSNEYLYQFNKNDFEARISPYLGYQLNKKDKLEFGLDYRLGRLLESEKKNTLWFRTTWYISI